MTDLQRKIRAYRDVNPGLSVKRVACDLGCSTATVYAAGNRLSYTLAQILTLFRSGKDTLEIANKFDAPEYEISNNLQIARDIYGHRGGPCSV